MLKGKERRCHPRFKAGRMQIIVRRQETDTEFGNGFKVVAFDYNYLGLGFITRIEFDIGERLEFELHLDGLVAHNVIGVLRNLDDGHYGVQFDYSAEGMQSERMIEVLEQMESRLHGAYSKTVVSTAFRKMKRRDRYTN